LAFIFRYGSSTLRTTFDERKAGRVALIGLVRVSTDKQKTRRQHDALDPICLKVFEEKVSGKLAAGDRPALLAALSHIRDGDLLTVQEVDRLGRNLLEGLIVLSGLFERGIGVKVLEGIAAGEHTEYRIPFFGFRGVPTGIDVFRVVETGILPVMDAGIPGRDGGQIGAGVIRAPRECFDAAAAAYRETYGTA